MKFVRIVKCINVKIIGSYNCVNKSLCKTSKKCPTNEIRGSLLNPVMIFFCLPTPGQAP